jgi:hypothetical protein
MTSYYLELVSSVIFLVWCAMLRDVQLAGSCKRVHHFFADAERIARLPNHFQIVFSISAILCICFDRLSQGAFCAIFRSNPKILALYMRSCSFLDCVFCMLSCGKDRDPEMFASECNLVVWRWLEYGSFLCFLF